jgi:hypothetical protein
MYCIFYFTVHSACKSQGIVKKSIYFVIIYRLALTTSADIEYKYKYKYIYIYIGIES